MNEQPQHKPWQFAFIGGNFSKETASHQRTIYDQVRYLSQVETGDRVIIVGFQEQYSPFLPGVKFMQGEVLEVISSTANGSVIVRWHERQIGLGAEIAKQILVTNDLALSGIEPVANANISSYLRDMPVGARGYIVGYDKAFLGYQGKLLAMGLKPGTEFMVVDRAFFGYLIEIAVSGIRLCLRKPEADALCVEGIEEDY